MATKSFTLSADFPKAVRGYSMLAVDDFVRQMGARLEALQASVDEQTERAQKLETELRSANSNLEAYISREAAIASAIVTAEQRRVMVDHSIEVDRTAAKLECESILSQARSEADALLAKANDDSEKIVEEARATGAQYLTDARDEGDRILAESHETAEMLKSESESASLSTLAEAASTAEITVREAREEAERIMAGAHDEAERIRSDVRSEIAQGENRLRGLTAGYTETVTRMRRVLEAQMSLLPDTPAVVSDRFHEGAVVSSAVEPAREAA